MGDNSQQRSRGGQRDPVWTLLSLVDGLDDASERARIAATAIPSVVPCTFSGLALLEGNGEWGLTAQRDLSVLAPPERDAVAALINPLLLRALERGHMIAIASGDEDSGVGAVLDQLRLTSLAIAPLLTLRSRIGALVVGWANREPPSVDRGALLSHIAESLSLSFENLRLKQALQRHSEHLEEMVSERTADLERSEKKHRVLLEVTRAISLHRDRDHLFKAIARSLAPLVDFERSAIFLRDVDRQMHVYALDAESPGPRIQEGVTFPMDDTAPGWALDQQKPFIGSSLQDYRPFPISHEVLAREGMHASCILPLIVDRHAIGVLIFYSRRQGHFDSVDHALLLEIADSVAVALDDCLAYEEITRLRDRLEAENVYLQEEIKSQHNFEEIIGASPCMLRVFEAAATVSATDTSVLISGETGSGKELIARAIHSRSERKDKPLIKVNCASIPRELFESEFFGHVRGAFTGAVKDRAGRFELADKGTLFLDEVGEIPLELQGKLLRVLQEGEFERIGEERTRTVDVRVIAATNRDLAREVREGRFREDLFYRIHVFPIDVPPLRDRREDIPLLAAHMLERAGRRLNKSGMSLTSRNVRDLQAHRWPGNVRELENVIERAAITARGSNLDFTSLGLASTPGPPRDRAPGQDLPIMTEEEMKALERDNLRAVLESTRWRVQGPGGAAEFLGVKPTTLRSRMKKLDLEEPTAPDRR